MKDESLQKRNNDFSQIKALEIQPSNIISEPQIVQQSSGSTVNHSVSYRPDIDGLRTIAVGIVILFHAWPSFMPGGFIGVDIFFVISGYLISSIIIKQSLKNKFSIADFYARRIKRIYPALIVVLVTVLVVACKYLQSLQLAKTTKTMAFSTIFSANLQILTQKASYFDTNTKNNPLLHLWSLGVQEQFYIVWPLVVSLVIKHCRERTLFFFGVFSLASFIVSIVMVQQSQKLAFYFPICRFWQMAIGGLIAYTKIRIQHKILSNLLSGFGFLGIFIVVWMIDEDKLFPGFWALIPTISACLIIQAGMGSYLNSQILSSKPFVFIGKISYPLYLWHWPLLVFSRSLFPSGSKSIFSNTFFIVSLTIVLSVLTYYFVQNKIRFRKGKNVVIILVLAMAVIGISSVLIWQYGKPAGVGKLWNYQDFQVYQDSMVPTQKDCYTKNGKCMPNVSLNPQRQEPTVDKIQISQTISNSVYSGYSPLMQKKVDESSKYYSQNISLIPVCYVANEGQKNQLFVVGDSFAEMISYRFKHLFEKAKQQNKLDKFPTILLMVEEGYQLASCHLNFKFIMQTIKKHLPKRIFFSYRTLMYWVRYDCYHNHFEPSTLQQNLKLVDEDIQLLTLILKQIKDLGIEVFFSTIAPEGPQYDPAQMVDINGIIEENIQPFRLSEFKERNKEYIKRFQAALKSIGVGIVDYADHLCWEDRCEVTTPKGYAIYRDNNHASSVFNAHWASSVDFLTQFNE